MTSAKVVLKLAAVASSVLLVGGFISYRAGALNWLTASEGPPAPVETSPSAEQPVDDTSLNPPAVMSGSKSAMFVVPVTPEAKGGQASGGPPPTVILPSSKSIAPLIPAGPPASTTTPPPARSQSPAPGK